MLVRAAVGHAGFRALIGLVERAAVLQRKIVYGERTISRVKRAPHGTAKSNNLLTKLLIVIGYGRLDDPKGMVATVNALDRDLGRLVGCHLVRRKVVA
jgi:hypothetical protein